MSPPKLKRIVAIDTMTLIWGVRKQGNKDKLQHARNLFQMLEREEAQVIVPSVVVAEFVTAFQSSEDRALAIAAISKRFLIEPFDVKDAALAAQLWHYGKTQREKKVAGSRICLRADSLIVATAKNHGAEIFYTEDQHCRDLATAAKMIARELPRIPDSLFEQ